MQYFFTKKNNKNITYILLSSTEYNDEPNSKRPTVYLNKDAFDIVNNFIKPQKDEINKHLSDQQDVQFWINTITDYLHNLHCSDPTCTYSVNLIKQIRDCVDFIVNGIYLDNYN